MDHHRQSAHSDITHDIYSPLKGSRLPAVDIGTQADSVGERVLSSDSESNQKVATDLRVRESMRVMVDASRNSRASDWSQLDKLSGEFPRREEQLTKSKEIKIMISNEQPSSRRLLYQGRRSPSANCLKGSNSYSHTSMVLRTTYFEPSLRY